MKVTKDYKRQKEEVIKEFATSFMVPAYKEIWGITLKCNTKLKEICWLQDKVLHYQEVSECIAPTITPDLHIIEYGIKKIPLCEVLDPLECLRCNSSQDTFVAPIYYTFTDTDDFTQFVNSKLINRRFLFARNTLVQTLGTQFTFNNSIGAIIPIIPFSSGETIAIFVF